MFKQLFSCLLFLACTINIYATQAPLKDNNSAKSQNIGNKKRIQQKLKSLIKRSKGDEGWVLRNLASRGLYEEMEYFFNQDKERVRYVNSQGKKTGDTALHHAVRRKDAAIVQLLMLKGANVHLKNNDGETPNRLVSKKDYNNKYITELCNKCLFTTNVTSDNYGFRITMPFRYPHLLEPLSKYPKHDPTILLIGPGAFFIEKISDNYQNIYLSKLNNTSPQLAETLALFPNAKKIDIIDINDKMGHVIKNTIQQLPHYEKAWDILLKPEKLTQLNPYQERLKKVFLNMKKNTNFLGEKGIKSIINFVKKNALHHKYPSKHYDIILALNVFLPKYLGKKQNEWKNILPTLIQALTPKGCLYIEHASLSLLIDTNLRNLTMDNAVLTVEKFCKKNKCTLLRNPLLREDKKEQPVTPKDKQGTNNSYIPLSIEYMVSTPLIIWGVKALS